MQSDIRSAALAHGYIDAQPATGHSFDLWLSRLKGTTLEGLSVIHDPAKVLGWPLEEITLWVAIGPEPVVTGWPEGCGEIGAHYLNQQTSRERQQGWQNAVTKMGYEIKGDVYFPDRAAAIRAGLGVHGLNGLLIAPQGGSFVHIAVRPVRAAPPPEAQGPEHDLSPGCARCGACFAACPSGAISENGLDAGLCLRSHMNNRENLKEADYPLMERRIMGCDTCQHVCPHNADLKRVSPGAEIIEQTKLETLLTAPALDSFLQSKWLNETLVKSHAVLAAANTGRKDLLPLVEALIDSEDTELGKRAKWAADKIQTRKMEECTNGNPRTGKNR